MSFLFTLYHQQKKNKFSLRNNGNYLKICLDSKQSVSQKAQRRNRLRKGTIVNYWKEAEQLNGKLGFFKTNFQ